MRVSVKQWPGLLFEAHMEPGVSAPEARLVVLGRERLILTPAQAEGIEVSEASDAEWSALRASGFELRQRPRLADNAAIRMALPVGRSGWAIAAGYAGLFALVIVPAPLALLLGGIAIWHLRNNPKKYGWGRAIFGFVAGLVGTAVLIFAMIR